MAARTVTTAKASELADDSSRIRPITTIPKTLTQRGVRYGAGSAMCLCSPKIMIPAIPRVYGIASLLHHSY